MKRGGILNLELNRAVSAMGHGDILIVCDAGFPIPTDAWRIDLSITADLPDQLTVLKPLLAELVVEKALADADQPEHNPLYHRQITELLGTTPLELVPRQVMLDELPRRAKVIVRTGALMPWGNVALVSGIDVPVWFRKPGVKVPEMFRIMMERGPREEGSL